MNAREEHEEPEHRPRPNDHLVEPVYHGLGARHERAEERSGLVARIVRALRRLARR